MLTHPVFLAQLAALLVLAVLHNVGAYAGLYYSPAWFDLVTHFLGGLWIALSAVWFVCFSPMSRVSPTAHMLVFVSFTAALTAGIGWEVFEMLIGTPQGAAHALDTRVDILMGMLGAFAATFGLTLRYA